MAAAELRFLSELPNLMDITMKFENRGGFWIAPVQTPYGIVEVMVGGSDLKPDERQTAALEPFFLRASEITVSTRKKLRFAFLYRLIRIAVNEQARIGLQFRNRLTGSQPLLFIEE